MQHRKRGSWKQENPINCRSFRVREKKTSTCVKVIAEGVCVTRNPYLLRSLSKSLSPLHAIPAFIFLFQSFKHFFLLQFLRELMRFCRTISLRARAANDGIHSRESVSDFCLPRSFGWGSLASARFIAKEDEWACCCSSSMRMIRKTERGSALANGFRTSVCNCVAFAFSSVVWERG